jgi:hypothetical protein
MKLKLLKVIILIKLIFFFYKYVQDLYTIKKDSTGPIKSVAKSLLNNLLGRLVLNIFKPQTTFMNKITRDYLFSTRLIKSHKVITNGKFLVTYIPGLNKVICLNMDKTHKSNEL